MLLTITAASFLIMCAALSGKLTVMRLFGPTVERNLHFLVSFAAGVLLIIAYNLAAEIVEHTGSLVGGLPWIIAGALVVLISFRYLPDLMHHAYAEDAVHARLDARRLLMSDAIHNIGDGIVLAVAFSVSLTLGAASAISIFIHEVFQEISEFFVLRDAGFSVRRALTYNFMVASTILIGSIGAYVLAEQFEAIEVPLLGLAAGSYLVIVFHDLIPHAFNTAHDRTLYLKHFLFFLMGVLIMVLMTAALPHEVV